MRHPLTIPSRRFGTGLLGLLAALALVSCDRPAGLVRKVRADLDSFQSNPTHATLAELDGSFQEIDALIREFEAREDFAQADLYRRQALSMRYEYRATRQAFLKWSEEQAAKLKPGPVATEATPTAD